ncbi:MAG: glycosyltransferase family 4 protein [Erysipelotrichaceae bacterium]|nr:glycosyltransferase family 4 protein [Erysipelotrichaceae bacterium]
MKKHILVISQYFYPEQFRINDICSEWVKRGYKVTVLTGIPNYPQGKFYDGYGFFWKRQEIYNGVQIIRIPLVPRGKNSLMLALNYLSFVVSGFFWNVFTKISADFVFIFEVSPMTQALPGVWYAKKLNIPCYLYVQDLWPENVQVITGITNKNVIGAIGKMVDYIYKRCTMIFTTSESFVKSIHDRDVPMSKIEFWPQYAEDFYVPLEKCEISEIPNDGVLNIIYAGNVGTAQGLDVLPKAAEIIKRTNDIDIRFNVIGDGRYKDELVNIVDSMGLSEMFNFVASQEATKIPELIAACDAAFLSLNDNSLFSMTIPAKLQTYLACGVPIIASAEGETSMIIDESDSGLCSRPGDAEELAVNFTKLARMSKSELRQLGKNARDYYEAHFSKNVLLDRMDQYFNVLH